MFSWNIYITLYKVSHIQEELILADYISYLRNFVGHSKVIMVVAGVFILDEQNRVLLQQRSDNGLWGHPGGYMELGETIEETARREIWEETGLTLGKLDLLGVYSGPNFERTLQNGDQVSLVKFMFTTREFSGNLHENNNETLKLRFFPLDELPEVWHLQLPAFEDLKKQGGPYIK